MRRVLSHSASPERVRSRPLPKSPPNVSPSFQLRRSAQPQPGHPDGICPPTLRQIIGYRFAAGTDIGIDARVDAKADISSGTIRGAGLCSPGGTGIVVDLSLQSVGTLPEHPALHSAEFLDRLMHDAAFAGKWDLGEGP